MQLTPLAVLGLLGFLSAFFPAQTKQGSRMALTTHEDACMGLDDAQCCAQSLELAAFRATGDQAKPGVKRSLAMSCGNSDKRVPESACRNIALLRGFAAKEVSVLCAADTLQKRCKQSEGCEACVQELERLKFKDGHRACYAVTHVPTDASTKVIVVDKGGAKAGEKSEEPPPEGALVIRKRRVVQ